MGAGFEWMNQRVRGLPREVLRCAGSSRVVYDVVLLPDAVVRSWCAVDTTVAAATATFVFEIEVQAEERRTSSSIRLSAADPRQWRPLVVKAPGRGPARIVLRVYPECEADDSRVLWAHPRIESPRPRADIVRAARAAFSRAGVRLWPASGPRTAEQLYEAHARTVRPSRSTLRVQRTQSRNDSRTFTLITVLDAAQCEVAATVESVFGQSYIHFEWIVMASRQAADVPLRRARDPRVRIVDVPHGVSRSEALNAALAASVGDFVALLDPGDTLGLDALFEMSAALEQAGGADVMYSDEDTLWHGKQAGPAFKPDWSPELLLSSNYIGRLTFIRRSVAAAVGFRDGAVDLEWDLLLRLSRANARFHRVPRCLYHRTAPMLKESTDRQPSDAGCADVAAHVAALGRTARVSAGSHGCRVVWPASGRLVSIVVPNRNAFAVVGQALEGVLQGTDYPEKELIIVDNASTDPAVLALYDRLERSGNGRIVPFPDPFNFSAACNRGAAAARGDLLLFLNNDIEVLERSWLEELVRWAELPEIGIVGPKLLYPDRTIQHAGVVFGIGLVGHIFARAAEKTTTPFGSPESYRNYLAVTGACQMMRHEVFEKLGGFDERFRLSFSDIVLCMEAWKAGYRVMYTPYARLVHHESYSRKKEDSAEDMLLLARYLEAQQFTEDPFFHPELDPKSAIPAVRPPLATAARQVVGEYVERVLAAGHV